MNGGCMTTYEAVLGYLEKNGQINTQEMLDFCQSNNIRGALQAMRTLIDEGRATLDKSVKPPILRVTA